MVHRKRRPLRLRAPKRKRGLVSRYNEQFTRNVLRNGARNSTVYEQGGIGHDMARDDVAARVTALATNNLCVAVVASPPCSTWSAARLEPGVPQVLRTRDYPMG
eukprot:5919155-Pleurochrysis_carterae.AAC.1